MVINPVPGEQLTAVPPMVIDAGSSRKQRLPLESTGVPMLRQSAFPLGQPDASNTLPVS